MAQLTMEKVLIFCYFLFFNGIIFVWKIFLYYFDFIEDNRVIYFHFFVGEQFMRDKQMMLNCKEDSTLLRWWVCHVQNV